jgi:ribosomal protein S18 acetylase RimI-like enzyme
VKHTIHPFGGAARDLDTIAWLLSESQRVLVPDYSAASLGFDRDDWRARLNDPQTEWALVRAPDGTPAGLAGWRYLPTMSHLHAIFVAHAHQRRGYGSALLAYHWQTVLARQPETQLFTLHVREPAVWAQALYQRQGYRFYQAGDESRWPALKAWIAFCQARKRWPLPRGVRQMFQMSPR